MYYTYLSEPDPQLGSKDRLFMLVTGHSVMTLFKTARFSDFMANKMLNSIKWEDCLICLPGHMVWGVAKYLFNPERSAFSKYPHLRSRPLDSVCARLDVSAQDCPRSSKRQSAGPLKHTKSTLSRIPLRSAIQGLVYPIMHHVLE